jgi:hypothetical protein
MKKMKTKKMIKQPDNSKLCGHCCLAEIKGITLEESIKLIGHKKGTYYKELIKHFEHGKKIIRGLPNKYSLCLIRPLEKTTWRGHWIVYFGDGTMFCYDPTLGDTIDINYMLTVLNARVVSHIEIL